MASGSNAARVGSSALYGRRRRTHLQRRSNKGPSVARGEPFMATLGNVPAAIVPDIKIPQSGQALYVFALPDSR